MIFNNLYMIAAVTEKTYTIGKNNDMIHYISEDLKYFKEKTKSNTVIFGYKTYMSLPKRPLPNRKNIILSRKKIKIDEGIIQKSSVEEIIEYIKEHPNEKIYICGGGVIYRLFEEYAKKIYLTIIEEDEKIQNGITFPKLNEKKWKKTLEINAKQKKKTDPNYKFTIWERA